MVKLKSNLILERKFKLYLNQDLGYDESLSGQPRAWFVKKMHAITKLQKRLHIEIQNDFQNMFRFYDSLYGL